MDQRERRELLQALLDRLERTGALSCPAADLKVAVDEVAEGGP